MSLKPVLQNPTPRALKNVKFRLSRNSTKFDVVARFHETIPTVKSVLSSGDLEKFGFLPKWTILPFFQKLDFLEVSHFNFFFVHFNCPKLLIFLSRTLFYLFLVLVILFLCNQISKM